MQESTISGIVFMAIGLFIMISALANWEYFFDNNKAKFFIKIFGRQGTRIFYIILGTALFTFGLLEVAGIILIANRP